MKAVEKLRILFEDEQDVQALEDWLDQVEQLFVTNLLKSSDADIIKNKYQYDAASKFRRHFLSFFDKK